MMRIVPCDEGPQLPHQWALLTTPAPMPPFMAGRQFVLWPMLIRARKYDRLVAQGYWGVCVDGLGTTIRLHTPPILPIHGSEPGFDPTLAPAPPEPMMEGSMFLDDVQQEKVPFADGLTSSS